VVEGGQGEVWLELTGGIGLNGEVAVGVVWACF
jgi:hypothetical protein